MSNITAPMSLSFREVARAPQVPGLYAWYVRPSLFKADIKTSCIGGEDVGQARTRAVLARHTARFDPPTRKLYGRSSFGGKWRGEMVDQGRQRIRHTLLQKAPGGKTSIEFKIHAATSTESKREYLSNILGAAHPLMAAPLYIGVTNNLRRRLREHSDGFIETKDYCQRIDGYLAKLKDQIDWRSADFAHRAAAAEFSSDNLFVVLLPLESCYDESEHEDILHAAEWLLNRWYTPPLGRK